MADSRYQAAFCLTAIAVMVMVVLLGLAASNPKHIYAVWQQVERDRSDTMVVRSYSTYNQTLLRRDLEAELQRHESCRCLKPSPRVLNQERLPSEVLKVRAHVYKRWQERQKILRPKPPLALCPAGSPLQFLASGIEIEPMESVTLVGLAASSDALESPSFMKHGGKMVFTSMHELGTLYLSCNADIHVEGNRTKQLILTTTSNHTSLLKTALKCIVYQSSDTYVLDLWDTIAVRFGENIFNIHIRIRRQPLPFLYPIGSLSPPIHERVTIITKSFERYPELNRLLESVAKFYPTTKVLIADDSVNFQRVDKPNVLQYRMPAQTGWFAGRNLLVSQVLTEYLVWVDDDCVFNENAKLEVFMEMLDKLELGLELVSGTLGKTTARYCGTCVYVDRDREGICLSIKEGCGYGQVEGYPHCYYTDRTPNFFMARTRSVQRAGFDPHYRHVAHIEFVLDGYDFLKSACCTDMYVDHIRGGNAFYNKNRLLEGTKLEEHIKYNVFKYGTRQWCY